MKRRIRANILLLLAALFWGSTFAAQRIATGYLSPFPFQGIRCLLGAALLWPMARLLDRSGSWRDSALWLGGVACGVCLFASINLQQFGLSLGTTAGKSSFITALYIILVPIYGVFMKKRPGLLCWIGVALAVGGLFLLCMDSSLSMQTGDLVTLICAFFFAAHILVVDHFSPHLDPIRMSCIQFLVCGVMSLIAMLFTDIPAPRDILACWAPLLYAAVFSSALAYTFQIIAQRDTNPTVASILMSTETVFAVLAGWLVLGERLSGRESLGCALMFCAVLLSQLPDRKTQSV